MPFTDLYLPAYELYELITGYALSDRSLCVDKLCLFVCLFVYF